MTEPLLTIVTVCFCNPEELRNTIISTAGLDSQFVERIVVDGSPDNSCASIIASLDVKIDFYVHEPDDGIYFAMNKGVKISSGISILMLNSGDLLYNAADFQRNLLGLKSQLRTHVIYGKTIDVIQGNSIERNYRDHVTSEEIRRGILPSHQSTLLPTWWCKKNKYDTDLKSSSDTKLLRRAYTDLPVEFCNSIFSVFTYGGQSNSATKFGQLLNLYREATTARNLRLHERITLALQLIGRWAVACVGGKSGLSKFQAKRANVRRTNR